jgi:WD40 repeat protein
VFAFAPDGKQLATASEDTIKLWDLTNGELLLTVTGDHLECIEDLAFSPGGNRFVTTSRFVHPDKTTSGFVHGDRDKKRPATQRFIRVWDAKTGKELSSRKWNCRSYALSRDGQLLLLEEGENATLTLCDASTGQLLQRFEEKGTIFASLASGPRGEHVAHCADGRIVKFFDFRKRSFISIETDENDLPDLNYLASSCDGKRLVGIGEKKRKFLVWDAQTGERLQSFNEREADHISGIALNQDTTRLATVDTEGMLTLWDVNTGQEVLSLKTSEGGVFNYHISFSPDGERLAVACGHAVGVWSAPPLKEDLALPLRKE